MIRKLLPKNPESAIAVLKHVWDQEYRDIEKRPLMDKYWKWNNELGEMFLEIGKSRARKNETKLSLIVNKLKSKYNSLRQACRLGEISWTKFHRHIYINKNKKATKKQEYNKKLSKDDIESIQNHYTSEEVSFPMPDKKYVGKRFMHSSRTRHIKCITYCLPLHIKSLLQHITNISLRQSNCKAKYLSGRVAVKNARTLRIPLVKFQST